jgi:hypothetical protein
VFAIYICTINTMFKSPFNRVRVACTTFMHMQIVFARAGDAKLPSYVAIA